VTCCSKSTRPSSTLGCRPARRCTPCTRPAATASGSPGGSTAPASSASSWTRAPFWSIVAPSTARTTRSTRGRTRTKDRARRTSVQSQSILQGCQMRAVRRHLGRPTTRNRESQSHVHIFLVVRPHPQATVITTPMVAPHLDRARPEWGGDPDGHLRALRAQPQLRDAVASQTLEDDRFQGATGTKTVAERRRGSSCACTVTGTALFGRGATRRTEPDEIAEQFWHRISNLTSGG